MKKAIKVFIIIGMVVGCLCIAPIIIGKKALNHLEEAKKPEDLKLWGILTLCFVSTIAGILMLVIKEEDLAVAPAEAVVDEPAVEEPVDAISSEEPVEEIAEPAVEEVEEPTVEADEVPAEDAE